MPYSNSFIFPHIMGVCILCNSQNSRRKLSAYSNRVLLSVMHSLILVGKECNIKGKNNKINRNRRDTNEKMK